VVREQALVFGEVAGEYADVRAGYPDELVTAVFEYLGRYREGHRAVRGGTDDLRGGGPGDGAGTTSPMRRSKPCWSRCTGGRPPELLDEPAHVPAPTEDWLTAELAGSAWFVDVEERRFRRAVPYPAQRYIRLLTTFSRHRMLPPDQRERLHTGIAEVLDAHGGVLDVQLDTVLALGGAQTSRRVARKCRSLLLGRVQSYTCTEGCDGYRADGRPGVVPGGPRRDPRDFGRRAAAKGDVHRDGWPGRRAGGPGRPARRPGRG